MLWHEQPGLFRGYLADVATAVILGIILIAGGRQRTQAPAWAVVNANGGPVAWGAVILCFGALLLFAAIEPTRLVTWALWTLALVHLILAMSFLVSVLNDPRDSGSFVGVLYAARASFMHVSRAQAYREEPRWTG